MVLYEFAFHHPRAFLENSTRYHKPSLLNAGLPLDLLISFASDDTLEYNCPAAKPHFETKTNLPWNALNGPKRLIVQCSRCQRNTQVP